MTNVGRAGKIDEVVRKSDVNKQRSGKLFFGLRMYLALYWWICKIPFILP